MIEIFTSIRDRCAAAQGIKFVDKDNGNQIDNLQPDKKPTVPFPCCLIKISINSCENLGGKTQLVTGSVVVRTAYDLMMQESSSKAPDTAVMRTLAYYGFADSVHDQLQGFTQGQFRSFQRMNGKDETRTDGLSVWSATYNFTYLDAR